MIKDDSEYCEAVARVHEDQNRLAEYRLHLAETGLSPEEIKRVIDPIESFHSQLREEVESYERLKRGTFAAGQEIF